MDQKIYEKAIKLIKIRPHHSEELVRKLLMRHFDRELVVEVIQKLQEEKLLDNQQFAQMYLDELIRNKTFGFYGLKAKLMTRGIASNEAEKLLKENLSIEKETELAQRVVAASERRASPILDGREREKNIDKLKLSQKLSRKGFRSEVIREVVKLHRL